MQYRVAKAGDGIEAGSRVVVLNGRNFPSFTAGDQGRVIRVDKEALNCEVLFDGAKQPVPVALRHLKLGASGASVNGRAQGDVEGDRDHGESSGRRKSSLSDGRSRSASPRRSVVFEPVTDSFEQRLRACEVALDSSSQITPRKARRDGRDVEDQLSVEDRLLQIEQRIKGEVEVLAKQLREAITFGQAQESRANALERHLKNSGISLPGSGVIPAAPPAPNSPFNSGPLYLSAALPPRLCATPGRSPTPPTGPAGPCISDEICGSCGALNKAGSKYCIKCGQGQDHPGQDRDSERGLRRPLSATALPASGSCQPASYVRGSSYLAPVPAHPGQSGSAQLLQATHSASLPMANPQMMALPSSQPTLPSGMIMPDLEACGVSPAPHISATGFTPPPVPPHGPILTPRLVLPPHPFG